MQTVKANFDGSDFFVTDTSSDLREPPAADFPLLPYLALLSQTGWKAAQGRFDGWTVILDLEKQAEIPEKPSIYMKVILHQLVDPEAWLSKAADFHHRLLSQLQEVRMEEGWEIIAGPKHLSSIKGIWTVAIWGKHPSGKQL
jgi:hypothetical protein